MRHQYTRVNCHTMSQVETVLVTTVAHWGDEDRVTVTYRGVPALNITPCPDNPGLLRIEDSLLHPGVSFCAPGVDLDTLN